MAKPIEEFPHFSAQTAIAPFHSDTSDMDVRRPVSLDNEIAGLAAALTSYELSFDQLRMIAHIVQPRQKGHGVDLKASVPFYINKRFYVRLLFGSERRNDERIRSEGQTAVHRVAFVQSAIVMLFLGYSAFGVLCSAYILKSLMGVNLMPGPSPLHILYQAFIQ